MVSNSVPVTEMETEYQAFCDQMSQEYKETFSSNSVTRMIKLKQVHDPNSDEKVIETTLLL